MHAHIAIGKYYLVADKLIYIETCYVLLAIDIWVRERNHAGEVGHKLKTYINQACALLLQRGSASLILLFYEQWLRELI